MHKITCLAKFVSLVTKDKYVRLSHRDSVEVDEVTDQMKNLERNKVIRISKVNRPVKLKTQDSKPQTSPKAETSTKTTSTSKSQAKTTASSAKTTESKSTKK